MFRNLSFVDFCWFYCMGLDAALRNKSSNDPRNWKNTLIQRFIKF